MVDLIAVVLIIVLIALGCAVPLLRSLYREQKKLKKLRSIPLGAYESFEEMKAKKIAEAMEEEE